MRQRIRPGLQPLEKGRGHRIDEIGDPLRLEDARGLGSGRADIPDVLSVTPRRQVMEHVLQNNEINRRIPKRIAVTSPHTSAVAEFSSFLRNSRTLSIEIEELNPSLPVIGDPARAHIKDDPAERWFDDLGDAAVDACDRLTPNRLLVVGTDLAEVDLDRLTVFFPQRSFPGQQLVPDEELVNPRSNAGIAFVCR